MTNGKYDAADSAANELARLRQQNMLLVKGIESVRDLINHSDGVSGLHGNGDIAEWGSLEVGGHFESWLMALNEAEEAIEGKQPHQDIPSFESTIPDLHALSIRGS